MGYYTQYDLEVRDVNTGKVIYDYELVAKLRESSDYAKFAIDENGDCSQECKWYDHEEDMLGFSNEHPDEIFVLSGEGEESGDIWTKYFVNGKVQVEKAEIKVDDFDATKLK